MSHIEMRLLLKPLIIAAFFTTLSGCAGTVDTFPLNPAAKQIGNIRAEFTRTGLGSGPVTITMPDGEVLASALVITSGPVQFVATGPKTQILCRGFSSTMGHGSGQCQTYEGAVWAVSW